MSISLGFNNGILERVGIADAHPRYGVSWDEWSEERQRQRALSIGTWITKLGFPKGSYLWGSVWYGYDSKGGSGSALVTYNKPTTLGI